MAVCSGHIAGKSLIVDGDIVDVVGVVVRLVIRFVVEKLL